MNIVLASDDNFVQHCGVAIISILKNNKDVHFFLLTEGLKSENVYVLQDLVTKNGGVLDICIVPSDTVKYFPMSKLASSHISIATYYRLFITSLLPENVDKVIYLDCDMVITGSLEDLWNTSIDGFALGAVYQHFGWSDHVKSWERLNIPREDGYFNAGGLLMNLDYLRNDNFQDKAVRYINENFNKIISHDQDVLNALYYKHTKPISCRWNYTPLFMSKLRSEMFPPRFDYAKDAKEVGVNPTVIHYVSKPKPWQFGCTHRYKNEYYQYLALTPWSHYRPRFNYKMFVRDVVVPTIKTIGRKLDVFGLIDVIKK